MNHHPATPPPDPVEPLAAVVCDQDRDENPLSWSELPPDIAPGWS
ncbi:hypothetical protein M2168_002222 [Streptomyces sp. CZ24]|nr:hypothetical protein [Streptomyces sp. CZ24]MDH6189190.1 hypothetical protein [Streptomyces sp. CZ24]